METVAASLVTLIVEVADQYGVPQAQLWSDARTVPLRGDPDALVPRRMLFDVLRALLVRSADPGVGLRIAEALDFRRQGFWGYAVLASMSMLERIELYRRYQSLRMPAAFRMHVEDDCANFDICCAGVPHDVKPVLLDCAFAAACANHRERLRGRDPGMQVWLTYSERPHHRELRRIVAGPVVFDAPLDRLQLRAADLELALAGDPHLGQLARAQLERAVPSSRASAPGDFVQAVRDLIAMSLAEGASHEQVASRLGISARTLRRRVHAHGTSFQVLLDEARRRRALESLEQRAHTVEDIAHALGYADCSNFRRAFRRWTGQTPAAYRDAQRVLGRK